MSQGGQWEQVILDEMQPIKSASVPQINSKKSQKDDKRNNKKTEVQSAQTQSIKKVRESIIEEKKNYSGNVFQWNIADLLLQNDIKIQKNKKYKVENISVKQIADSFRQFLDNQKRKVMFDPDQQEDKGILEQNFKTLISNLFGANQNNQNVLADMNGEIDIMLSSKQPYTMAFGKKIESAIEQKSKNINSMFWIIQNFTDRIPLSIQIQQRTPTRFFIQIKTDPLCLNYKKEEERQNQMIKNIKQILRLVLYSKQKDEKQFNRKYIPGLKSKMRFIQASQLYYHNDKPIYPIQGFKPTVLYYIINKNTDRQAFMKDFGAYKNILKPWFLWLNAYMHVICYNVDDKISKDIEEIKKKAEEDRKKAEEKFLDLEKKAQEERKKAEEQRQKAEQERQKAEEKLLDLERKAEEERQKDRKKVQDLQRRAEEERSIRLKEQIQSEKKILDLQQKLQQILKQQKREK